MQLRIKKKKKKKQKKIKSSPKKKKKKKTKAQDSSQKKTYRRKKKKKKKNHNQHEKMLNIANYQRNVNQNYHEISLHTSQNGHNQKIYKQQMLERLWRKECPPTLLVGMLAGATTMENNMEITQKTKYRTTL